MRTKTVDRFEPPHGRGRRLDDPKTPHKRVAEDVDPYNSKIICKNIDAKPCVADLGVRGFCGGSKPPPNAMMGVKSFSDLPDF